MPGIEVIDLDANADLWNSGGLMDNPGLGPGDGVYLTGTSVTCADVAVLEARGVTVASGCE